ncbi:hypothetical protein Wildcat_13 [Mycobacterium phage Wildcat]|uniref:LexA repressor DNA-binding domain-containing protein n=4 Tax=Mycobacterium virus Wildcat TaxID=1993859 RepID=Q19Y47_9CAUD|nr:hypothetical protein Wildcat_13 [Mycobacterium phage Wildcat]AJD82085.1 LexA-like DNA binding domain protein [Mycobacterium phage Cosmo]AQT25685.1 DNA binding protein [Mycobacterium phage EniyanLRS]QGJ89903.1 hypothetical protein PBI_MARYV_13 [Mycobacterium phage MaryV]WKR36033.1 hypothetical protein [Mycobacterium phage Azrael100]ABE67618.1 hypothetical protein Wildcat_13 [Mycobacterium phage Wildcat]
MSAKSSVDMLSEARHTDILVFIEKYWASNGFAPSVRDITKGVGLNSPATTKHHLDKLKALGRITFTPGIARSVRVTL